MSDILEKFYYGNIEPQESITKLKSEIKKKLDALSQTDEQLTLKSAESGKQLGIWDRRRLDHLKFPHLKAPRNNPLELL